MYVAVKGSKVLAIVNDKHNAEWLAMILEGRNNPNVVKLSDDGTSPDACDCILENAIRGHHFYRVYIDFLTGTITSVYEVEFVEAVKQGWIAPDASVPDTFDVQTHPHTDDAIRFIAIVFAQDRTHAQLIARERFVDALKNLANNVAEVYKTTPVEDDEDNLPF